MPVSALVLLILGLAAVGYVTARARAAAFAGGPSKTIHSRPGHHGFYVAAWAAIPALLVVVAGLSLTPRLADAAAVDTIPAAERPATPTDRQAFLDEVHGLVTGDLEAGFDPHSEKAVPAYKAARNEIALGTFAAALAIGIAAGLFGFTRVRPTFRARTKVERLVMGLLVLASLIAVLTTFGIVLSLLFESMRFFAQVSPIEFLTGTSWSPQTAIRADQAGNSGAFGAVPLFWGTIFIGAIIAMIVAIPLGLMSAIWLTQYAAASTRRILKPMLEILAGVPTVVYGYFAALTVAPALREFAVSLGIPNASSESALAAGLVMGVMIIPFVSSMADDSIAAVPQAMKDGSLAMGATTSETIRRVLVPAALPGIVGGVLLAVSRAIGETMIVVMAAGLAANLTLNPFASVTTVTTQIVQLLTGDQEFDSTKTLSAFALGLVLFVVTLILNVVALRVVKRYREAYE